MKYSILSISAIVMVFSTVLPHAFSDDILNLKLGEEFEIGSNQTVSLPQENIVIRLVNVTDSRCPSDVTCIWAGQTSVDLDIQKNRHAYPLSLVSLGGKSLAVKSFDHYVVQLIKVDPYPISGKTISFSDYIVTLRILNKSPLDQFKSGIPAREVTCTQDFVLVLKSENNTPACVKPESVSKLVQRGWASLVT